jgi:hypothetical protein
VIRFHPDAERELTRLDVLTQTGLLAALKRIDADPNLLGSLGVVGSPSRWTRVGGCLVRFRRVESTTLPGDPFTLVTSIRSLEGERP